jgi:hypothetical protein
MVRKTEIPSGDKRDTGDVNAVPFLRSAGVLFNSMPHVKSETS